MAKLISPDISPYRVSIVSTGISNNVTIVVMKTIATNELGIFLDILLNCVIMINVIKVIAIE